MARKKDVIIPQMLARMVNELIPQNIENPRHAENLRYINGWIQGAAERNYRELIKRDGNPDDPRAIKLFCEIAMLRGLVEWHEIKDQPPPIPSIHTKKK